MEHSIITGPRRDLVERLRFRGISDRWVLAAVAAVPREVFGLPTDDEEIYSVAAMVQALDIQTGDQVLEIGTGSGYSAAVISMLAGHVYSIDCVPDVVTTARARMASLGYHRIAIRCSEGTSGWPEHGPYNRIVVRVLTRTVPEQLQAQLAVGGRFVLPQSDGQIQRLVRITRSPERFQVETLGEVSCSPVLDQARERRLFEFAPDTD